jgi:hypothetical protein
MGGKEKKMSKESIIGLVLTCILLVYLVFQIINLLKHRNSPGFISLILLVVGVIFALLLVYRGKELSTGELAQTLLTIGLVTITAVYTWSTEKMAQATKIQAEASVKMAEEAKQQALASFKMVEEAREQRIIESRPIIVQRAAYYTPLSSPQPIFSHFEFLNIGKSPAVEVEISIFDENKTRRSSEIHSFYRTEEVTIMRLDWDLKDFIGMKGFVVSEYQSVYSRDSGKWYQTWLPFNILPTYDSDDTIILTDKLDLREVDQDNRIGAFVLPKKRV